jgi:hypothetical protein
MPLLLSSALTYDGKAIVIALVSKWIYGYRDLWLGWIADCVYLFYRPGDLGPQRLLSLC